MNLPLPLLPARWVVLVLLCAAHVGSCSRFHVVRGMRGFLLISSREGRVLRCFLREGQIHNHRLSRLEDPLEGLIQQFDTPPKEILDFGLSTAGLLTTPHHPSIQVHRHTGTRHTVKQSTRSNFTSCLRLPAVVKRELSTTFNLHLLFVLIKLHLRGRHRQQPFLPLPHPTFPPPKEYRSAVPWLFHLRSIGF
jgi:hypothetical protein